MEQFFSMAFHREAFLREGTIKEALFAALMGNARLTNGQEDIQNHVDVEIKITFDVKGQRRIKRSDLEPSDDFTWVELVNVQGKHGWIAGKAHYIAFELADTWLIVDRERLLELVKTKMSKEICKSPEPYMLYQRSGRKDKLTLVPIADIKAIALMELDKQTDVKFER